MSVQLQKGQKVSLVKENVGLSKVVVGLGWDEAIVGADIDCDAFAMLTIQGKIADKSDVVYFGRLSHASGAVRHMGDNLTGAGEGDDEQIMIDLDKVPAQYDKIVIAVNIYKCTSRNQHFGMINNAFIRIVDSRNNKELCIYNLTESYSGMTAVVFGEIYRKDGDWKFNAIGEGTHDTSVAMVAQRYGLAGDVVSSGGCYVATAVYGSYDCEPVWTLRRFRDYTLAETWYGRAFIHTYYAISPTLVRWFGKTKWFQTLWRGVLDKMVARLNQKGVENTPYEDIDWK